jgi:hypothetical protein
MSKMCYKNMAVSAYGADQYAESVTVEDSAVYEEIKVLGVPATAKVMVNKPRGTMSFTSIMTAADQVSSLQGRMGKVSKAGGVGEEAEQTVKAGAMTMPKTSRMTSMSVIAQANSVVKISSTMEYDGQSNFGGSQSAGASQKIEPLLAANISGTMVNLETAEEIEFGNCGSVTYSTSQSFAKSEKVGSDDDNYTLQQGKITLQIEGDTDLLGYDEVPITGSGGICPTGSEDKREYWEYNIGIYDCSGLLHGHAAVYTISGSGALESRSTAASPEGALKTTYTLVEPTPNEMFPDLTTDCA